MKFLTRSKKALVLSIGLLVASAPVKAVPQYSHDEIINVINKVFITEDQIHNGHSVESVFYIEDIIADLHTRGHGSIAAFLNELRSMDLHALFFQTNQLVRIATVTNLARKHGVDGILMVKLGKCLGKWKNKDHVIIQALSRTREEINLNQ